MAMDYEYLLRLDWINEGLAFQEGEKRRLKWDDVNGRMAFQEGIPRNSFVGSVDAFRGYDALSREAQQYKEMTSLREKSVFPKPLIIEGPIFPKKII